MILLTFLDGVLHRTKRFAPDYRYTTGFLGSTYIDEIVIANVTPGQDARAPTFVAEAEKYADACFAPITVGGHVRTVDDVNFWLRHGADKVLLAEKYVVDGGLAIAGKFGGQVLVAGIDYDRHEAARAVTAAGVAIRFGAGELLLNSIGRDGSLEGYDVDTLQAVAAACPLNPIVIAGGCGRWEHMCQAFQAGASGACTSVIHHLTDSSMRACKEWLAANCPVPVRPVDKTEGSS